MFEECIASTAGINSDSLVRLDWKIWRERVWPWGFLSALRTGSCGFHNTRISWIRLADSQSGLSLSS